MQWSRGRKSGECTHGMGSEHDVAIYGTAKYKGLLDRLSDIEDWYKRRKAKRGRRSSPVFCARRCQGRSWTYDTGTKGDWWTAATWGAVCGRAIAKALDGRRGAFILPPICAELSPALTGAESGRSTKPLIPWNLAMNFGRFRAGHLAGETADATLRLIMVPNGTSRKGSGPMGTMDAPHKRWNKRRNGLEDVGANHMAAAVGEWIEAGENAPDALGKITLEDLEENRRMALCPSADSGWPGHAECRAEGDRIDWLVHGVYMVRDGVGNWRAIGKDGVVLKTWGAVKGRDV